MAYMRDGETIWSLWLYALLLCTKKIILRDKTMIKERRHFPRTFVFWRAELTLEGQSGPTSLHATEVSDIGIGLVGESALPVGATCTLTQIGRASCRERV